MVGANLQRLIAAHEKANLPIGLMLKQLELARATLFPFLLLF